MWCAIAGFVGGMIVAPAIYAGFKPALKRIVMGGILVGYAVSDATHGARASLREVIDTAKAEAAARHPEPGPQPVP